MHAQLEDEVAGRKGWRVDAQGGWYEGEWCAGEREGAGARLMRNGALKAGRWRKGGLDRQLEPRECAPAVRAAQQAAAAARRCFHWS
jgi:hypothetical protein